MLQHGGNTDVALTLAQTARRTLPDSPNVADTLALAYYQKGVYSSAIDLLEEAVKKQPQNATMHYHLGMAYQKVGKPDWQARVLQSRPVARCHHGLQSTW